MNRWYKKKRKFLANKLDIELPVIAYDSPFVLDIPTFIRPFLRKVFDQLLNLIDGKIIFDKKIYKKTFYEVIRYIHLQVFIVAQIIIGRMFYVVRRLFKINIFFTLKEKTITKKLRQKVIFMFPWSVNCLIYEDHVPLSFMAFQVDKKTLATSFRDYKFAQSIFNKFKFTGLTVLAWTSNYFLGYPVRIELDKESKKEISTKDLLITTCASIPGFNQGIKQKSFFINSLNRKYSEESFPGNPEAINFSGIENSEITKPIVVKRGTDGYHFKIVTKDQALKEMKYENTLNIIFPIAVLNDKNKDSVEWKTTPQKNLSGFLLGYKKDRPISVSISSTSLIRMKINELMPFINYFCSKEKIKFFAYIHTDDGGAVGDFYKKGERIGRFAPIWGHCFSSLCGFVDTEREIEVTKKLKYWQD